MARPRTPPRSTPLLQAIMDPSDTSFPRLSCPAPNHIRYDYLKVTRPSTLSKPRYSFALDLHTCAPLFPHLLDTIIETIRFLGPSNCALSIIEGRSHDGTYSVLYSLIPALTALNITYRFTTTISTPKPATASTVWKHSPSSATMLSISSPSPQRTLTPIQQSSLSTTSPSAWKTSSTGASCKGEHDLRNGLDLRRRDLLPCLGQPRHEWRPVLRDPTVG